MPDKKPTPSPTPRPPKRDTPAPSRRPAREVILEDEMPRYRREKVIDTVRPPPRPRPRE